MRKRSLVLLGMMLICVFLSAGAFAEWLPDASLWRTVDGSTATIPLTEAMASYFGQADNAPYHETTPRAYDYLCNNTPYNTTDLLFVTIPAAEDFAIAREAGVELEVIPVVREGIVFINNTANPADSLTAEELRSIYAGVITNWKEVGGLDAHIAAYQRDVRSGSQTVFLQALMGDVQPVQPEKALVIETMGTLIDQVAGYDNAPNALGYTMYYYIANMYSAPTIRVLSVDGIVPSTETIATGEYPLCTTYCAVLRADTPEDHPARQLLAWLQSEEGQAVTRSAGYLPLRAFAEEGATR